LVVAVGVIANCWRGWDTTPLVHYKLVVSGGFENYHEQIGKQQWIFTKFG